MNSITPLAARMKDLREQKQALEDALKAINKELDLIRMVYLPDAMDSEGVARITIDGIGTISLRDDVRASIRAEVRPQAWEWMIENGFEDLITRTVNASTLRAWAKEQRKEGVQIPENLITVAPFTYAVITKS